MTAKSKAVNPAVERRDGVRANRVIAVSHRLVRRGKRAVNSVWSLSTTRNMSVSGLLFMSPVAYKAGDLLELEVVMSGMIEVYCGPAQVVRVVESSAASFDIAVKYVELKARSRSASRHHK